MIHDLMMAGLLKALREGGTDAARRVVCDMSDATLTENIAALDQILPLVRAEAQRRSKVAGPASPAGAPGPRMYEARFEMGTSEETRRAQEEFRPLVERIDLYGPRIKLSDPDMDTLATAAIEFQLVYPGAKILGAESDLRSP